MPEIRTYVDRDSEIPDITNLGKREIVVFTVRSPTKTTRNEDSIAWIAWPDALLVVLADGVGGYPGGGTASGLAVQGLVDRFKNVNDDQISLDVFRDGVLDAFESANVEIQQLGNGSATTLTALTIAGDRVRVFNVGDSSTLICGGKGKLKFANTAHSPTGYAIAAGMLHSDDALHHDERHLISNIVGSPEMHIDIGPVQKLSPRDRIVVASDGLWDNMYVDEVNKAIRIVPLPKAAGFMAATCRTRMGREGGQLPGHADDLSFVVIRSLSMRSTPPPAQIPLPEVPETTPPDAAS
jgi:serine/threonine protein phosphatase PrpC